jgi:hypothetical protein
MTSKISLLKNSVLFVVLALIPLAAEKASAQNREVIVDVPFAFVANHTSLPAGHYRIIADHSFLYLSDADTGDSQAVLITRAESNSPVEEASKLEFYVSGSRHLLTEVRFAGTGSRSVLLRQPKRERVVAGNTLPAGKFLEIASR